MLKKEAIKVLVNYLKSQGHLWSFNLSQIDEIPDPLLIELILIHGDIKEIDLLCSTYEKSEIEEIWLDKLVKNEYYEYAAADIALAVFDKNDPFDFVRNYREKNAPK